MKKLLITISLAIFVILSHAQSKSYKMYDAFANKDGVLSFTFSKNMVDAINIDLEEDGDKKSVTGDLQQVKFMSYNPEKGKLTGDEFRQKIAEYLKKSDCYRYAGKESDEEAEIWLSGGKKKFTECHVIVVNDDNNDLQFIVSFYGDFNVNDIKSLKRSGAKISLN